MIVGVDLGVTGTTTLDGIVDLSATLVCAAAAFMMVGTATAAPLLCGIMFKFAARALRKFLSGKSWSFCVVV